MLPAEPPTPEPAGAPAASAGPTRDEPVPAEQQAQSADAALPEDAGDAAVAGEYEPL
ncbi:hypothetical protein PV392_00610 [Streptomyces sp. ME03-5709C]|nr:hypothetical protein [Streptomyces sp. ME03-5709C]